MGLELNIHIMLLIAIVCRIIVNPLSNVLQKKITQQNQHPLFINFFTYLVLACISIYFIYDYPLQRLDSDFWTYSIIGGVIGALGNGFIVKALEKGDLSVLGPINAYKAIIGMLFAFLIMGELPNKWGILGMLLIIIGSYFVLDTSNERFSWKIFKKPEIQYRLWALVLTGIQAATDKHVIQHSNLKLAFASWSIFGAIFSFLFILLTPIQVMTEFAKMNKKIITQFMLLVCTVGIMLISTNYTLLNMPVAYALALFQLSIILSVILGHRIFKEGHLIKKLLGAFIMVSGSVLIILLK